MPHDTYVLHDFRGISPSVNYTQSESLDWLAAAHSKAESRAGSVGALSDSERMRKLFARFGCSPDKVGSRSSFLEDFRHRNFHEMEVFNLSRSPRGAGTSARVRFFGRVANEGFARFYAEDAVPPRAIFHVTCTGYDAPNAAERLVSRKGWGNQTEVYPIYHMGCYASIPATKLALSLLSSERPHESQKIDLVHTELCSIHLDPSKHTPEQLVIQSLFADGMIRYSISHNPGTLGLELLSSERVIVPNSEHAMTWTLGDHGMEMTLSREVPDLIKTSGIKTSGPPLTTWFSGNRTPLFAIHPGGPKIIDQIQESLELSDEQVAASRAVLRECGNMSSATLPYIWMKILDDPAVEVGTPIVSLAFGPGLTICSNVLRKVAA